MSLLATRPQKAFQSTAVLTNDVQQGSSDAQAISVAVHDFATLLNEKNPDLSRQEDADLFVHEDFLGTVPSPWQGFALRDWSGLCATMAAVTKRYPGWNMKVKSVRTQISEADEQVDCVYADAFVNFDVENEPPGILRQSIGLMRFKNIKGIWECFSFQSMDGIAPCWR